MTHKNIVIIFSLILTTISSTVFAEDTNSDLESGNLIASGKTVTFYESLKGTTTFWYYVPRGATIYLTRATSQGENWMGYTGGGGQGDGVIATIMNDQSDIIWSNNLDNMKKVGHGTVTLKINKDADLDKDYATYFTEFASDYFFRELLTGLPLGWGGHKVIVKLILARYKYKFYFNDNGGTSGPGTVGPDNTSANGWIDATTWTLNVDNVSKPTKSGYIFDGWYDSATGGNKITGNVELSGKINEEVNKTLYAHWTPITYSISFNGNGSTSGSMSNQSFTYDMSKALTSNAFKKEYTVTFNGNGGTSGASSLTSSATFNGWEDRGSITYNGTTYSYTQFDAPYYANTYGDLYDAFGYNKYNLIQHYVNWGKGEGRSIKGTNPGLYPDGATVNNLSTTANGIVPLYANWSDMSAVTFPSATREGYTFEGWYTSASGGTKVGGNGSSYIPSGNITLYAQWTLAKYTATFNYNGGNGTPTSSEYDINSPLSLPSASKSNYTFSNWIVTIAEGNWTVDDTYTGSSVSAGKYGNVTLMAQYTPIGYTITYDPNGGSVSPTTQSYNIESTSTLAVPTRPGFGFNGWKATSTSEGSWTNGSSYEGGMSLTGKYGNVTLQAQWNEGEYTATFVANGGTVSPTSDSYKVTERLALPVPVRKGYKFKGWKVTEAATGGNWSTDDALYTGSLAPEGKYGDVTLTAQWEAIPKGDLKITVKGLEDGDNAVITVVSETTGLEHAEYTISVQSSANTATIKNLYEGSYTVTSGGWQWKYTVSDTNPKTATVSKDVPAEVTFTLSAKSDLPKHDESSKVNVLSKE